MKLISWNCSDHHALVVDTQYSEEKGMKAFQFEANWVKHEDFLRTMQEGWNGVDGIVEDRVLDLVRRLLSCQQKLLMWSKKEFPNFKKVITHLKNKLSRCYSGYMTATDLLEAEEVVRLLEEAWSNEESYWWQRSRVSWLNCGDKNSRFFHSTVV
ncbi:hypothetical protein K1719_037265 [Acacia pycnantha]|nr:hypothetical protein K1719_037265 [Acacia pycnantha]